MIKRIFDLILSAAGLALIAPMLILIGVWIWLSDGRPIIFRQTRIGRYGRPFTMLKFRTMRESASSKLLTIGDDGRITPAGRVLRKYKLDEFPQLINVLLGQMSLVGPRPEVAHYVSKYSESQRVVLELKPGITDLASLEMFDESQVLAAAEDPESFYISVVMPRKIELNLYYARRSNIFTDLFIIFATLIRALGVKVDVRRWLNI